MPVFTRDSDKYDCPYFHSFCETNLGPGPAILNAASAQPDKERVGIEYSDPTLRNPNAALDSYNSRMAPEVVIGVVLVVLLVLFAVGLWVSLDERPRKKVKQWMRCAGKRKAADVDDEKVLNSPSPSARSDLTRVNTRADDAGNVLGIQVPLARTSTRGMPSPLRNDATEGVKSAPQSGHAMPVLHSQS